MEKIPTFMQVAALALVDPSGQILMHRRRNAAMHGGLWEFPGGKLEPGESHEDAVIREIAEELGVALEPHWLEEVGEAANEIDPGSTAHAVAIRLFMAREWQGEPLCLEGEEIGWFAPEAIADLAMPPLDYPLAAQLRCYLTKEAK